MTLKAKTTWRQTIGVLPVRLVRLALRLEHRIGAQHWSALESFPGSQLSVKVLHLYIFEYNHIKIKADFLQN